MVDSRVTDTTPHAYVDRNHTIFAKHVEKCSLSNTKFATVEVAENLRKALGSDPDRQTALNDF